MSANKQNNLASQAILEMENIKAAIKEESKSTISSMLQEAVKQAMREEIENDDEYDVIDGQEETEKGTDETDTQIGDKKEEVPAAETTVEEPAEQSTENLDVEPEDNQDTSEYDRYKVGDDTWDLTGENDYKTVARVYKLLSDDDQVIIKKTGDKVELKDNEAGTDYIIDLGEDGETEGKDEGTEETPELPADNETPEVGGAEDPETETELNDQDEDEKKAKEPVNENNKNTKETMKESNEVILEVNLGYTDNYQDKDPIQGLSMTEPSKSGKSWHKGVPTGTEKPWAGETKTKGDPFEKTVNEEEEIAGFQEEVPTVETPETELDEHDSKARLRSTVKTRVRDGQQCPAGTRHASVAGQYKERLEEMQKENKELKEAIKELRASLNEAYMTNVNLGKITKLFLENTTTKAEKVDIINRFTNEAKTVDQSKALFEAIDKQLKKAPVVEKITENVGPKTVMGSQVINENKAQKSKDVMEVIDFMNRMSNC